MPIYANSEQLNTSMRLLFDRIRDQDAVVSSTVQSARLLIRLRCTAPEAEININGRQRPLQINFGVSSLRPDLSVELPADALHHILMADLPLKKALASGQLKVTGPVFKIFALEEIFHRGQTLYPSIAREMGLNGYSRLT